MSGAEQVFEIEIENGTLLLIPVDQQIGFRARQLQEQTEQVVQSIAQGEVRNVIVDAVNMPYLPSAVISAFIHIWETVVEQGGRFAMCNLSDDALQGLIVTRLDTRWQTFGSRNEALTAIRT